MKVIGVRADIFLHVLPISSQLNGTVPRSFLDGLVVYTNFAVAFCSLRRPRQQYTIARRLVGEL